MLPLGMNIPPAHPGEPEALVELDSDGDQVTENSQSSPRIWVNSKALI